MTDLPLHPALVHLPLAFVLFSPLLGYALLRATEGMADETRRRGLWRLVVVWMFVQSLVIYATMVTGEQDADLVLAHLQDTAAAEAVSTHEDAATWLLLLSLAGLLVAFMALKPGPQHRTLAMATIGLQLLALVCAVYTAKLGGELVYRHGAANAHMESEASAPKPRPTPEP